MEESYCEEATEAKNCDRFYYSPATSDSDTDGDELDGEDDIDIRKNIKPILNLGQTIPALFPIALLEQAEDAGEDLEDFGHDSNPLSRSAGEGNLACEKFFETRHRRAPSLPSQVKLDELKLDEIQLNLNEEYGFNHKRAVRGRQKCGRNSVSLYASNERLIDIISLSTQNEFNDYLLSSNNLPVRSKSLARNQAEIKLEEEIARLRAQPSKVEFSRKNEAKQRFQKIIDRRSQRKGRIRSKSLKRKLSFDSHPRRRAFSDGENMGKKGNKNDVKIQDLKNAKFKLPQNREVSPIRLAPQFGSVPDISDCGGAIKLAPPPVLKDKAIIEVLVTNVPPNQVKEKKRKGSIPQFFNAIKLPNKKAIKKFIRRKNDRQRNPVGPNIHASFGPEGEVQPSNFLSEAEENKENMPSSPSVNTFDRSRKTAGSSDTRAKERKFFENSGSVKIKSCSTCSLPKVEEGKECSKFDGTLAKSCSTCSIVAAKLFGSAKEENVPALERRMSDTALSWKQERRPSCSPGRRLILRLLSPVVCGLSHDKYSSFQSCESYTSLNSCSSDISIEAEFLAQTLANFNVQDVAEELSLIDKELLIRITWQELSNCGWMSIDKFVTSPNVMNMVEFFNRVAMMVASSILAEDSVYLRAKVISKMIKLADKCRVMKNYNSLRAVLGGLQCTPIFRLEATWKQVRTRKKRLFSDLSNLMGETENFAAYRSELAVSLKDAPCLPFLGDFLTQIAQTQAYLAIQRKRTFTKQRLEKASVSSACNKDEAGSPSLAKGNVSEGSEHVPRPTLDCCDTDANPEEMSSRNNELEKSSKKLENFQNCSSAEEKNTCYNVDETDNGLACSNNERNNFVEDAYESCGLFDVDVKDLEDRSDLIDLHELVLQSSCHGDDSASCAFSSQNDERQSEIYTVVDTATNDAEKSLLPHKSLGTDDQFSEGTFVTAANNAKQDLLPHIILGTGEEYSETSNEINTIVSTATKDEDEILLSLKCLRSEEKFSDVSNECLECSDLQDNSVFIGDEFSDSASTPIIDSGYETHEFNFGDNPKIQIDLCSCELKSQKEIANHKSDGFVGDSNPGNCESCDCRDSGVGSSSSYESSSHGSNHKETPNQNALISGDYEDNADKRTHNRCDSNDSGVILHNGRSSRASDELNCSREDLDMIEEANDNSHFEDSNTSSDVRVDVRNCPDSTDNRTKTDSLKKKTFLERKADFFKEDHIEESRKLEEMIKKGKPTEEQSKIQKEYQFWQYQIAAMQYHYASKPSIRKFLLNACYNSEEENYSLSLKREPIRR